VEVKIAAASDLWDDEMKGYVAEGVPVLLVRLDGTVRAYADRCAHLGVPLSEGELVDGTVICAAHRYEYDGRTGAGVNPRSVCLRGFPCSERDGAVFVELTVNGSTP
jgi:nitrite reductase/ring-hydroxylating ferredoxin subunit